MKTLKYFFGNKINMVILLALPSILMISSCEKEGDLDETEIIESLASEVVGIYSGTLKNSATNQSKTASLTVTMENDSIVYLHCIAEGFDSTIVTQLYQNYDSIMICLTGQDFFNEYGHNRNSYDFCYSRPSGWMNNAWMNDGSCCGNSSQNWGNNNWAGSDQWNAWTNHMNTQHNQSDTHFGGFDPAMNSCNYTFAMGNDPNSYFEVFSGIKTN